MPFRRRTRSNAASAAASAASPSAPRWGGPGRLRLPGGPPGGHSSGLPRLLPSHSVTAAPKA
eukprot:8287306-Lingulodinium_polyedra.AAC.1